MIMGSLRTATLTTKMACCEHHASQCFAVYVDRERCSCDAASVTTGFPHAAAKLVGQYTSTRKAALSWACGRQREPRRYETAAGSRKPCSRMQPRGGGERDSPTKVAEFVFCYGVRGERPSVGSSVSTMARLAAAEGSVSEVPDDAMPLTGMVLRSDVQPEGGLVVGFGYACPSM